MNYPQTSHRSRNVGGVGMTTDEKEIHCVECGKPILVANGETFSVDLGVVDIEVAKEEIRCPKCQKKNWMRRMVNR